jgi:flagellum-specific peptidoglycan hydrolase FlgJ
MTFEWQGDRSEWIEKVAVIAQHLQERDSIPASITIAQAIYESGFGKSRLARQGYNYFGVKYASSMLGKGGVIGYIVARDDNPRDNFVAYDSPYWSFNHHSRLLLKLYKKQLPSAGDYKGWLAALCGCQDTSMRLDRVDSRKLQYATSCLRRYKDTPYSRYIYAIDFVINHFNLTKYDKIGKADT